MNKNTIPCLAFASITLASCGGTPPGVVKANDYGEKWPLTVQEAKIGCETPFIAYVEANGVRYALNGNAIRAGLQKPDDIKKDPSTMFVADFTEKAMQLCKKQ